MGTAITIGVGVVIGVAATYVGIAIYFAKKWPG